MIVNVLKNQDAKTVYIVSNKKTKNMDTELIHEVTKIDAQINKSNPPQLHVSAS